MQAASRHRCVDYTLHAIVSVVVFDRARLADKAYQWIKDQILARELVPGQRLSVPAIAEELDLSRSPVREAVQRLVQEGLSEERPHKGAVVASVDVLELVDLYEVRAALEGLSAQRAVRARDAMLLEELTAIHRDHRAAANDGRLADVIRADMLFHGRIAAAAGNAQLVRSLAPLLQRMSLAMLAGEQERTAEALSEHEAVIEAIRAGEPERARDSMTDHLERVRTRLLARVSDTEEVAL
ncbi:GntR family transcriptional regulator [Dactylosporangium fulvum]|uniref:GntR family transcriptional regulator n=1 Tax=Dactylosporangium fulvum TaxID=53359 RepID=A0ABY5WDT0_9ACTN|nr:GntR family transcriptional regulator [Dactylosporangium fulvum]UWP87494.1 GntR family transcriptional regulator [Dactylosporangium fulvum]